MADTFARAPLCARLHLSRLPARRTPEGGADETLLLAYRRAARAAALHTTRVASHSAPRVCRLDDVTLNQKELVLIEKLDFQLIAEHPYQHLETLLAGACRTQSCFAVSHLLHD